MDPMKNIMLTRSSWKISYACFPFSENNATIKGCAMAIIISAVKIRPKVPKITFIIKFLISLTSLNLDSLGAITVEKEPESSGYIDITLEAIAYIPASTGPRIATIISTSSLPEIEVKPRAIPNR